MGTYEKHHRRTGFTLIEISIVIVIIGLILGGILVGQSLISAAAVRATITQVEKFNSSANNFYSKFGYLPGDIPAGPALQFGFAARGPYAGQGDGNGLIEGNGSNSAIGNSGHVPSTGETAMFWVDLSAVGLIDGSFTTASPTAPPGSSVTATSTPAISAYLPAAKLGGGNYFYLWSGGFSYAPPSGLALYDAKFNFLGLSAVSQLPAGDAVSSPGLTVRQAYGIDKKIDDGLPQTGNVVAVYETTGGIFWAAGGGVGNSGTGAVTGSSTTCYDNNGVGLGIQQYSVEVSDGSNINCALSIKITAGD